MGRIKSALSGAASNAKAFAVLGGVYSAALCYAQRLSGELSREWKGTHPVLRVHPPKSD